jgi:hypothetical protein
MRERERYRKKEENRKKRKKQNLQARFVKVC